MLKRNYIFLIAVCLCILVLFMIKGKLTKLCGLKGNKSSITKINYKGWEGSYKLSNQEIELVVVPKIARIMSCSFKGEGNILWQDSNLEGRVEDMNYKEWLNYGGYKLWNAPQSAWGWPPDPSLDRGPCKVETKGDHTIILTGMKSKNMGIRFTREIRIFEKSNKVQIKQIMENISDKDVEWGIWEVTQLLPKGRALLPLSSDKKYWDKDEASKHEDWDIREEEEMIYFTHNSAKGKVFVMTDKGWIAYELDGVVYIKTFKSILDKPYPEGESNIELFSDDNYIELEVVSPLIHLKPGEKYTFTENWHLFRVDKPSSTNEELREFIERKIKEM